MRPAFWQHKRVAVTGHTGFKGTWLSLWLNAMGADVFGYALEALPGSLYRDAGVDAVVDSTIGDACDAEALRAYLSASRPEVVFHLAAQSLVLDGYADPERTFVVNVHGLVTLLGAVRAVDSVRAVIVVTSDKCYRPRSGPWGLREDEPMGGDDPYSASKGCAELVAHCYRTSFFQDGPAIVSVRAGNVIGGGDWSANRLVPDAMRALHADETLVVRNAAAIRPWQHVCEPLRGYLDVAERACSGELRSNAYNFGPGVRGERTVAQVVEALVALAGGRLRWEVEGAALHENPVLRLDVTRADIELGWRPALPFEDAVAWTYAWYADGGLPARDRTMRDLRRYEALITRDGETA